MFLLDVLPGLAQRDSADCLFGDAEALAKHGRAGASRVLLTNHEHVVSRQFGRQMGFSFELPRALEPRAPIPSALVDGLDMASLVPHVLHVVGQRAEKQMVGVAAGRVVAAMKDAHIARNRSVCQFPSDAMGKMHTTIDAKFSVPEAIAVAEKWTAMTFEDGGHFCPKPRCKARVVAEIVKDGTLRTHRLTSQSVSRGGMLKHRRPTIVPTFANTLRSFCLAATIRTANQCEKEWHCHRV